MQLLSVIHIFVEYLSGLVKGTDNIVGSLTASVMDMLSSFIGFCDGLQHVLYWHIAGQPYQQCSIQLVAVFRVNQATSML